MATMKPAISPLPRTVGVVGLGLMGSSIAACLVSSGFRVIGYARRATTVRRSGGYLREALRDLKRHESKPVALTPLLRRYRATTSIADLARCDFAIESVIEDLKIKQGLIGDLEQVLPVRAVIASNTSSIPISIL